MNLIDVQNCDLYNPDYIVPLRDVDVIEWYSWARSRNLKGIIYAFFYKNVLIKVGCSYANFNTRQNTNFCDRLIRQLNNLPGRVEATKDSQNYKIDYGFIPASNNGQDIIEIILEFQEQTGIKVDRNQMYLHVWDITNLDSDAYFWRSNDSGNKQKALYFEALIVDQYKKDNNGLLPVGNKKCDPSTTNNAYTKPQIAIEAGKLFVFD